MYEEEIRQLATEIRRRVVEYKGLHPNAGRKQVIVRRPDLTLKYREDPGFANDFETKHIEKDAWDWVDQQSFQKSVVNALGEYECVESALRAKSMSVEQFARAVCFASYQGLDDVEMDARVSAFGRELEGKSLPVTVTAFIDGLSLGESPLVVSDRLLLRRPTHDDVAESVLLDEHGSHSIPLGETWFRVVGEFLYDAVYTGLAQAEFLRTLEAFRLFKVGGVSTNRYTMQSRHSFLSGRVTTLGGGGRYSRYQYALSASDSAPLSAFLRDLVPVLSDPFQPVKVESEAEIAHARYRDALFQSGLAEQEITSAVTALEALFLKGESELTHRLAQRVSVFLRVLGTQDDAASTYSTIVKGYKIRSKFIHGESLKPDDRPAADSLAKVLLEYVRESVLAFFQLKAKKAEILARLDRTMIDPTAVNELQASMGTVMHK